MLAVILFQLVRLSAIPAAALWLGTRGGREMRAARWAAAFIVAAGAGDLLLTLAASGEPIRVDLVLLLPLVAIADLAAGYAALRRGNGFAVRTGAMALLALGAAGVSAQILMARHTAEVNGLLDQKRKLLFEARFRDEASFRRAFGEITSATDPVAGHYQPAERHWWLSRVVINASGDAWLYYHHGETESLYGRGRQVTPGVFEVRQDLTEQAHRFTLSPAERDWRATLSSSRGSDPRVNGVLLRRTAPRFSGAPPDTGEIAGRGVYSNVQPVSEQHRRLVQLWLWHNGSEIWGCYVRSIQVRNTLARFIHPARFEGKLTRRAGGVLTFSAKAGDDSLVGVLPKGSLLLRIDYRGSPLEEVTLEPRAVIEDEIFDFAPPSSRRAQQEWFRAVLTGTFVEWRVE
jgi:hypothetical protein